MVALMNGVEARRGEFGRGDGGGGGGGDGCCGCGGDGCCGGGGSRVRYREYTCLVYGPLMMIVLLWFLDNFSVNE